jgi:hypothetical protein
MRGIAEILGVEIAVPDFSTLSRRGNGVILQTSPSADKQAAIHLVADSTGLKIFGEGEWLEEKHKTRRKRRSWRKLHLGLDLVSGEIVSSDLTTDDVGDPTALPGLLDQVDGPVALFLADGAYDGEPTSDLLAARFGSMIEVTIPPPKTAILSAIAGQNPTARDCHIADIAARGRMAWQKASGYNQRSRGETPHGPLEGRHRAQAKSSRLRKPENGSEDWRPRAEPDARTRSSAFRTHRLKSISGRACSEPPLIYATRLFQVRPTCSWACYKVWDYRCRPLQQTIRHLLFRRRIRTPEIERDQC